MKPSIFILLTLCFASPIYSQEPSPPPDQYPEIMELIQQKRFPAAMNKVKPLREDFPDNAEVHLFETAILEGMGNYVRCEDLAEEYLQKYPDSVNTDQAYYLLGSARVKAGTREAGIESLRKAREVTDDPTLQSQIERMIGSFVQSLDRIGIHLGGQPPDTPEDKEKLCKISLRILRRALRDFQEAHEQYPEELDRLLDGSPPILSSLPINPFASNGRFEYQRTESGFELTKPIGK